MLKTVRPPAEFGGGWEGVLDKTAAIDELVNSLTAGAFFLENIPRKHTGPLPASMQRCAIYHTQPPSLVGRTDGLAMSSIPL
jgi:hypothetical protein